MQPFNSSGRGLVSVLMGVHNGAQFLNEAAASILSQTYGNLELIVVDDCSTDQTAEILASITDPRCKVFRNDRNIGLTESLNIGLAIAHGEFIARQDADDISHPERIARQVAFLHDQPNVGIVGTAYQTIDEEGRPLAVFRQPENDFEIRWQMLFHNAFCHSSVVLRRKILNDSTLYNSDFKYSQDFEAWSRLIQHTSGANLIEPFVNYRIHRDAISHQRREKQQDLARSVSRANINRFAKTDILSDDTIDQLRALFYGRLLGSVSSDAFVPLALYQNLLNKHVKAADHSCARALLRREKTKLHRTVKHMDGSLLRRLYMHAQIYCMNSR